jgi:hypothetical protein
LTNGFAPAQSEWAGNGFLERDGVRQLYAATITITERRGRTFKALARAGSVKFTIEGEISDGGEMSHRITEVIESANIPLENVTGDGEVRKNRLTLAFKNPDTRGTARFELKRLADAGFQFVGRWKWLHRPPGSTGFRTVIEDATIVDPKGSKEGTWARDGGLIIVSFAAGGFEYLAIDPDNLNELSGGKSNLAVTWVRQ